MCILIKFNCLKYLFESTSHWFNTILPLYLHFNCFLISYIFFYFFNYKKDPRFLRTFNIWILSFYIILIKADCLFKIFAHIVSVIIHLIIKTFYNLVISFVHIQFIVIEHYITFIFFSNIILTFFNLLAKYSHSASNSIEFNKFWLIIWLVYHIIIS